MENVGILRVVCTCVNYCPTRIYRKSHYVCHVRRKFKQCTYLALTPLEQTFLEFSLCFLYVALFVRLLLFEFVPVLMCRYAVFLYHFLCYYQARTVVPCTQQTTRFSGHSDRSRAALSSRSRATLSRDRRHNGQSDLYITALPRTDKEDSVLEEWNGDSLGLSDNGDYEYNA